MDLFIGGALAQFVLNLILLYLIHELRKSIKK